MTKQRKIIVIAIAAWFLTVFIYAYFYIKTALVLSDQNSYEGEWQFQLLMFSLFRLPWLLLGLAVVVAFIVRSFKKL